MIFLLNDCTQCQQGNHCAKSCFAEHVHAPPVGHDVCSACYACPVPDVKMPDLTHVCYTQLPYSCHTVMGRFALIMSKH